MCVAGQIAFLSHSHLGENDCHWDEDSRALQRKADDGGVKIAMLTRTPNSAPNTIFGGQALMAKYGKKASDEVGKTMHERKKGTLKSGRSGKKVKSRKQAIAIGLSKARREGGKVPSKKSSSKSK